MRYKEVLACISIFAICLMISIAGGQDWLEGGFVRSYSGDIARYFTDPIFYTKVPISQPLSFYPRYIGNQQFYPYYPYYPYYPTQSEFRNRSLAAMQWEPFQKNWAATEQYAQTKSSFRIYPRPTNAYPTILFPASIYTTVQPPSAVSGDSTATIVSQGMRGYQILLDGDYIGTEGTGGDLPDGKFIFRVVGNQNHEIRVYDGQFNYPKTMFFERGGTKTIYVEPGTAIYI